jgi:hypothetical protein
MRAFFSPACVALVFAVGLTAGCGPSDEEVCDDLLSTLADAFERCSPGTRDAVYLELEKQYGGCDEVKDIRDEDALYDVCIPSIEALSCQELLAAHLDVSCRNQLLL